VALRCHWAVAGGDCCTGQMTELSPAVPVRVQRLVDTLIMRCHSGLGVCIDGCVPAAACLPSTARVCALQRPPPHNNLGWSVSRACTRCVGECIGLRCIAHERLALGVRVCTASLRWLPDPHRVRVADPREVRCVVVCGRFVPHRVHCLSKFQ